MKDTLNVAVFAVEVDGADVNSDPTVTESVQAVLVVRIPVWVEPRAIASLAAIVLPLAVTPATRFVVKLRY